MMFAAQYANPVAAFPMMDAATAMRMTPGSPLNPGPAGPMIDAGPSAIRLTDPSRYGTRPGLFGGGPMYQAGASPQPSPAAIPAPGAPAAKAAGAGMFANPGKHKLGWGDVAGALLRAAVGYEAGMGVPGAAAQLQNLNELAQYRMKKADTDAQTAQYVQALIARGLDPNEAVIMAADPAEMAKHIGTHFDQKVLNQGDTLATPNLNGTLGTYTAPDIQRNGADIVQTPGLQGVSAPFSSLPVGGPPQQIGAPTPIPGLRTDAEQYAASTGAQPDSPQWMRAVQDFTLKDHGPTAFGFDQTLQGARLNNALTIAQGHDSTSRYRTDNPPPRAERAGPTARPATPATVVGGIMAKQAAGQALTPAEQATLVDYRTRHKPQSGAVQVSPNEPVATDAHGNKLVVRNGQWVPAH